MPEMKIESFWSGCGIYQPIDSEPYILIAGKGGCQKYSLDGETQELVDKCDNSGHGVTIVSLGYKTYAFGTDKGKKVEVWNGQGWDLAPQEFQTKTTRQYSGVMAVPKDFVC